MHLGAHAAVSFLRIFLHIGQQNTPAANHHDAHRAPQTPARGVLNWLRMASGVGAGMEALLRLDEGLDVALLDRVVAAFYAGHGPEHERAKAVVTALQEHPDAWQRVDRILECSSSVQTKFIALQILERLVKTRWNALPREQCDGIKNYVVSLVIRTAQADAPGRGERMLLGKLNLVLVQVLKQEWPRRWPTFISEVVASSRTSAALCENNMAILKLLSEEVFDFSAEQMTTVRAKTLKSQLCAEFSEVFTLCMEVIDRASKTSLLLATLEALLRFLRWIPLGYVFETGLVKALHGRFLSAPVFRNAALKCLTEISGLGAGAEYDAHVCYLFEATLSSVEGAVPYAPGLDLNAAYAAAGDDEQRFIQNLALFLSTCLGTNIRALEAGVPRERVLAAHAYLLKVSLVDDREVFKVCLEYWARLVSALYAEYPFAGAQPGGLFGAPAAQGTRRAMYASTLSALRVVMIERMVKPEEVLVVEDDNGEIVREAVKETDTIVLGKAMREVLVYLTHLDVEDTVAIMTEKLARQLDESEWSWTRLNRLCWAVGSISGAMHEEAEKNFLVHVIRDLLTLTELKRGKDNKAVVASNIMYIVGQYPRFLRAHWRFLKTVANKLFEFMHELHEGVQDMACDTFIKIAKKCRRQFVVAQPGEAAPFIDDVLARLPAIICDLAPGQVHTVYEALGHTIHALAAPFGEADAGPVSPETRLLVEGYVQRLMALPNASWDTIVGAAAASGDGPSAVLSSPETLRSLSNILRSNAAACAAVGPLFGAQVSRMYADMLAVYGAVSRLVGAQVGAQGAVATRTPLVRAMRAVKKDVLRLVETYVARVDDAAAAASVFAPPLLDAILGDYARSVEQARDAEVLSVVTALVSRLGAHMEPLVGPVLGAVFEPTLAMINKDFAEFPEHRVQFFRLLSAVATHCFRALLRMPAPQLRLLLDSVLWAIKHPHTDVAELGLGMLLELLQRMSAAASEAGRGGDAEASGLAEAFFASHLLAILQDVFFVLTDADYRAGFRLQAAVLAHLFLVVHAGQVRAPLWKASGAAVSAEAVAAGDAAAASSGVAEGNRAFLRAHTARMLLCAFPHLQATQVDTFVRGLFDLHADAATFRAHVRDFLIALREFAGSEEAAAELYAEEAELEQERKRKADMEAALRIPGMVKPSDDLSD